jgi:hypothetical protein
MRGQTVRKGEVAKMLFVEVKTSRQSVDSETRTTLIERLQEKGLTPLIRSTRVSCYEQALLGPDHVHEMERDVAAWTEKVEERLYVRGDVFCFEDFVLFLIFGEQKEKEAGMRAGIVYDAGVLEPLKKLGAFCRNVSDTLEAIRGSASGNDEGDADEEWQARESSVVNCLGRFSAAEQQQRGTSPEAIKNEMGQSLTVELLEDIAARRLLRRVIESQTEGRVSDILSGAENEVAAAALINRMADAGLLRREVMVSCRKKERSLFRLPSPDALNVITASNVICSECGADISDEKIEDLVKPTDRAAQLLEDGSWLTARISTALGELGIPENQVVMGEPSEDGEAHVMVNVCGESFLFLLRDGDVSATHARHALSKQIETEAAHLVVVASGRIQEEARERLREYERRRTRSGGDVEVIMIEGMAIGDELRQAFERVSQRSLAGELSVLDAGLGLSVGFIIATRFRLMQREGALKDLAESAVGALAGSLREF